MNSVEQLDAKVKSLEREVIGLKNRGYGFIGQHDHFNNNQGQIFKGDAVNVTTDTGFTPFSKFAPSAGGGEYMIGTTANAFAFRPTVNTLLGDSASPEFAVSMSTASNPMTGLASFALDQPGLCSEPNLRTGQCNKTGLFRLLG